MEYSEPESGDRGRVIIRVEGNGQKANVSVGKMEEMIEIEVLEGNEGELIIQGQWWIDNCKRTMLLMR